MSTSEKNNKRDASSMEDQKHFWNLLNDFKEVFLLSRGTDGIEHGRPMRIASASETEGIYFFTNLNSPKVEEVKKDDKHSVVITGQMSDKWISASGTATVVTDKEKIKELWSEGLRPWFPEGTNDSDVSLLCVHPEKGEYWDQSTVSNKLNFAWEFGKAYFTGNKLSKTIDKGGEQHSKVELSQAAK